MRFVTSPETVLDPICDMVVDLAEARTKGLTAEHEGRVFAFCAPGCRLKFLKDPQRYAEKVVAHAAAHSEGARHGAVTIDEGVRHWYESCRCCLSDAYPDVVAQLDAERDAAQASKAGPGICETAEAASPR